jgi:hypothetical protein
VVGVRLHGSKIALQADGAPHPEHQIQGKANAKASLRGVGLCKAASLRMRGKYYRADPAATHFERLTLARILWPRVLRIAPSQLFSNGPIGVVPETGEVIRDLLRSAVRRQEMQ